MSKNAFVFSSCGANRNQNRGLIARLAQKGFSVKGDFFCPGVAPILRTRRPCSTAYTRCGAAEATDVEGGWRVQEFNTSHEAAPS
jgi:hypothetical protein